MTFLLTWHWEGNRKIEALSFIGSYKYSICVLIMYIYADKYAGSSSDSIFLRVAKQAFD